MQIFRAALPVALAAGFSAAVLTGCGSSNSSAPSTSPSTSSSMTSSSSSSMTSSGSSSSSTTSGDHNYPQAIEDTFMDECTKSSEGETAVCQCTYDKLEAHYTLDQFKAIDDRARENQELLPADQAYLQSAVTECK